MAMKLGWGPPIEPPADMRVAAAQLRQMYQALLAAGFTEHQALVILGRMIAAQNREL